MKKLSTAGDSLVAAAQVVVHQQLLHRRLGHHVALIRKPVGELCRQPSVGSATEITSSSRRTWVGVALGSWSRRLALDMSASARSAQPRCAFVEPLVGDAEGPARLDDVADL